MGTYHFILIFCLLTLRVKCDVDTGSLKDVANPQQSELSESTYLGVPQPQKRSTLLLDRLVYALQKALKQDSEQAVDMELQRRGPGGRVYWRCYFNAVSCFRRK